MVKSFHNVSEMLKGLSFYKIFSQSVFHIERFSRYLRSFTQILNELHDLSRTYSNVIPNAGVQVLSGLDIFDSRDNLYDYIMAVYRDLIFRAFDWHAEFEEFVGDISIDRDEYVRQLTACFRSLPRSFENESRQDLQAILAC
jgi:hypothetical protein